MTALDALAAALRERIVDGRPAPLPGLGTLVRQHVSARVEERPDGSRTLLPPGETIALAEPDGPGGETAESVAAAFGRRRGLAPGEEDAALAEVMDQIEARLAATGEVRLHGVGLLRRTSGGVVLGVESSLLESVNRAYEGLTPIPARPAAPPEAAPPEADDEEPPADEAEADETETEEATPPPGEEPETGGADAADDADDGRAVEEDATPDEPASEDAGDESDVSSLAALALPDLLPRPGDDPAAPPDAEPDALGSRSPVAPPEAPSADRDGDDAAPPETADDEPETAAVDDTLAVPFGLPKGETLSDVLPPTPPDADPAYEEPAPQDDDAPVAEDADTDGEAPVSVPEPDTDDPGGAGKGSDAVEDADTGGADKPGADAWMSSTWAAPGPTPPPPALGDAPLFEDAEVIDDGSGPPSPPPVSDEPAPSEPSDDASEGAAPPAEPPAPEPAPPPSPRPRRVPVDRVGPPIEAPSAGPPPVEALRGGAAVPPDDLATRAERSRTVPSADGGRGFPWWVVAALAVALLVALGWWLLTRSPAAPEGPPPDVQTTAAVPEVSSANPPDSLLAPATPAEALGPPPEAGDAAPPEATRAAEPEAAGAQPPRVPGGAANLAPPPLSGLDADDRAALSGGALDLADRDSWTFVVASLRDRGDADAVRQQYREAGYKTALVSGGGFHRVAVGQFRSRSQALRLRDRLPPQAPPDTWALSLQTL